MKRGDFLWAAAFLGVSAIFLLPESHDWFIAATQAAPYWMGFAKFAVMASMGELLAVRIVTGGWKWNAGFPVKAVVWGLIGILVVLMFAVFTNGVAGAVESGLLPGGDGFPGTLLNAFLVSAIMNLTFGPAFMAAHRILDTYIDLRVEGSSPPISQVIGRIDWPGFYTFVVGRTVPFFWIPAHTITFLLPSVYRVLWAAYLSIALGAMLAYARRKTSMDSASAKSLASQDGG
jgi:hypothetical protein